MTRERIEDFREIVLPFVRSVLLKTNYERLGKSDAEEFEKDFNEILDMAIKALDQLPKLQNRCYALTHGQMCMFCPYDCERRTTAKREDKE